MVCKRTMSAAPDVIHVIVEHVCQSVIPSPSLQADYCMGVDRKLTIDARDLAADTSRFSACHMNHSGQRSNVARRCVRSEQRISFYAARDIQVIQ